MMMTEIEGEKTKTLEEKLSTSGLEKRLLR